MSKLDRLRKILGILGDKQKALKYVHIAGTNGKGSTAAFINNILISAGYKVGLFTSPGIHKLNDRIRVNNIEISDDELRAIFKEFNHALSKLYCFNVKEVPSDFYECFEYYKRNFGLVQFEIITCIAFIYYNYMKCDIVVLETGIGGRLDPTNIIDSPEVAVITTIDYDHMNILGSTLEEIAEEKAGIIKQGTTTVCYDYPDNIKRVFQDRCRELNSKLQFADFNKIRVNHRSFDGQVFDYKDIKNIRTNMLGVHQANNVVLAVEATLALINKGYKITKENILEGIKETYWEGRFEVISKEPFFIIDGAHNKEGVSTLVKNLKIYFKDRKIIFVTGILNDKDIGDAFKLTTPIAEFYVTIAPNSARAVNPKDYAKLIRTYCHDKSVVPFDNIKEGINYAIQHASKDNVICVFGSLYLVDEVKKLFSRSGTVGKFEARISEFLKD